MGNCISCNSGYAVSLTACTATGSICPNGIKESGEACDDNNAVALDGCSATCTIETASPAWNCTGTTPTVCTRCQNNKYEPSNSEGCDDGNNINGDGCSQTCTVETNYICTTTVGSPSVCTKQCGIGGY